ncbi:MAG TPA: LysE family transporter [Chitinophagaceae bacterium]|jgi:threonine/homoserine/homoserine lactone efflux protein|nr:LysE family transporter [Chitinophagaceae bacterium]
MLEALWKGIVLGLVLSLSVSPVLFATLKQSINNGIKGGISFILGVSVSDILLALATNLFTEAISFMKEQQDPIGFLSSILLISIGVYFLFFKKVQVNEEGAVVIRFRKRDYVKIFLAGFFMNILNPFILIFWLNMAALFVQHTLNERVVLYGTALSLLLAVDLTKVFLAQKLRRKLTYKNIHLMNQINGGILILFGLAIIVFSLFW